MDWDISHHSCRFCFGLVLVFTLTWNVPTNLAVWGLFGTLLVGCSHIVMGSNQWDYVWIRFLHRFKILIHWPFQKVLPVGIGKTKQLLIVLWEEHPSGMDVNLKWAFLEEIFFRYPFFLHTWSSFLLSLHLSASLPPRSPTLSLLHQRSLVPS